MNLEREQPFTIHQYHYSVTSHDAISNHLFWIQDVLKKSGIAGEIFASQISELPEGKVQPFKKANLWNCDLLLIHHSQGNPDLKRLLDIEVPKALIYHNITPEEFFRHDPFLSELCKTGRHQLKELQRECSVGFGISEYNLKDLRATGFAQTQKLPLTDIVFEEKTTSRTFHPEKPATLLFAGRIARHKNQALLIKTFYYLKDSLPKGSELVLVGKGDPIYTKYLRLLIKQLGLSKDVVLTGKLSDKELQKQYEKATAFFCTSLHEGFCLPLVEAMKAGLPVFALSTEGVLETLDCAGLHLHTAQPNEIAAVLHEALSRKEVLEALHASSRERIRTLSLFQNATVLTERIVTLAEQIRNLSPHERKKMYELR